LHRGALFRFRPVDPQPIVVRDVSGGNVRYMISPSIMLIADSTLIVYEVVSPLMPTACETVILENCCT
jgi:hypothetical protein